VRGPETRAREELKVIWCGERAGEAGGGGESMARDNAELVGGNLYGMREKFERVALPRKMATLHLPPSEARRRGAWEGAGGHGLGGPPGRWR
jgi:hypothetical protein